MSIQTIERTTLTNLIWDEDYARKVIPFIKPEYYADRNERVIFEEITKFTEKYNAIPTQEALTIELDNRKDINDEDYKKIVDIIASLEKTDVDTQWLLDTTEKFCKDKAIYNAVLEGIGIIDGKDKERTPEAIPSILSEALAVSFDSHVGHDYVEDGSERYDFYHKKEEKIQFDLDYFTMDDGGVVNASSRGYMREGGQGAGVPNVRGHSGADAPHDRGRKLARGGGACAHGAMDLGHAGPARDGDRSACREPGSGRHSRALHGARLGLRPLVCAAPGLLPLGESGNLGAPSRGARHRFAGMAVIQA